jgi:hypothetical protein
MLSAVSKSARYSRQGKRESQHTVTHLERNRAIILLRSSNIRPIDYVFLSGNEAEQTNGSWMSSLFKEHDQTKTDDQQGKKYSINLLQELNIDLIEQPRTQECP